MKRVIVHSAGGYERLSLESAPDPLVADGALRVDVSACGVNYADCVVRMGLYESAKKYVGWPITPGFEVSGHVDGRPVMAVTRFGGYSDTLALPADQVFDLPPKLTLEEAAGFPTVFLTAWFALYELAHPRPGSTLLVHSAAGGVGSALTQLGKVLGCRVIGVVGAPHKVETAAAAGADHVIDKSTEALWPAVERLAPGGCDVICDANGVATLQDSYEHLAAPGKLVVYGFHTMLPRGRGKPWWPTLAWKWLRTPRFSPLRLTGENRSVLGFNLSYLFERKEILQEAMAQLLALLKDGRLRPLPVTCYPLDAVADAHRALESGQTVGKLVLRTR